MRTRFKVSAERVYLLLTGGYSFTYSLVLTVALVYQTQEAGLNPFQLVVVGAALQVSTFLLEVPTGVFADVKGRRPSVVIGVALMGLAYALMGLSTSFWTILISQILVGGALTFTSGAQEAWIADEVGVDHASVVYLRSAQTVQYARLFGIPAGVALGAVSLRLPLIAGGLMFALLAAFLTVTMSEARAGGEAGGRPGFRRTLGEGMHVFRATPILPTLFGMVAFYQLSGEVFLRLSVAHFLNDVGLPKAGHLEPVVWFGIMRMASALAGIGAVQYLRRTVDVGNQEKVTGWLMRINALQAVCLLVFALSHAFALALIAYLLATSLSRVFQPLYLTLVNSHVESGVRATMISMSSQVDALSQSIGAPVLGAVASLVSIRAALVGAAMVLVPALGLNARAAEQQRGERGMSPEAPAAN